MQDSEIVEENNYYPFGLKHKGYNNVVNGTENMYKFNGKELEEDLGLNTYDYGARSYMPDVVRWRSIDPHADSYFSVTPYSSFANNPISFVDPTGKDILFWQWQGGTGEDSEGEWKQVTYNKLDKKTQTAISNFAKTKSGKSLLGSFANKGDKIGDVEFTEDGKFANHNFNLKEFSSYGSAEGVTRGPINNTVSGPVQEGEKALSYIDFRILLNRGGSNDSDLNAVETLGHEAFLHLSQYLDDYVKAFEANDIEGMNSVMAKHKNGNPEGARNHLNMSNPNSKEAEKYNQFINQLKSVFNPRAVQKHVNKERQKNLNHAKRKL